jgi:NAD(P) transhydrogenase subunit alpha
MAGGSSIAAAAAQVAAEKALEAVAAAQAAADAAMVAAAAAQAGIGGHPIDPFVFRLAIFVLAVFVGYYVVWSVTPALHTPLMSVTNAISSVIVVGALLAVGVPVAQGAEHASSLASKLFGFAAVTLASVNIVGGFLVTQRMLAMYRRRERQG